jgi:PAS domain S-box-containing protein
VDPHPSPDAGTAEDLLRRRLEDSERWVRLLDGQIRLLERERQKLSAVVNHADAGFLVFDPALRVTWANDLFAKRISTESNATGILGAPCHQVLCRQDAVCETCPAATPFRTREVAHHELTLDIGGTPRQIYTTAMPILSPRGEVDQTMVMVQDVSNLEVLRRSEQMLRQSEERLRLLVSQMPAILWTIDRGLRFTSSVGGGLSQLGLAPGQVVGMHLFDYLGTHDTEALPLAAHLRAMEGESVSFELEWQERTLQVHVEPLLNEKGTIIGAVGAALDITERKGAELALRRSEARKDAVLRTALDAIITMDHDGAVVEFNPAAEQMFGISREEALGRPLADLIVPERLRDAHSDGLSRLLRTGEQRLVGRRIESFALRRDGTEFPVEVAITRISIDGPPTFTGHIRDLTERKAAEDRLREREEQLRQSQKMEAIGTLAGGVAHDFNNILTGILGYAALLKKGAEPGDRVHRAAEVIEKGAQRGAGLTRQLLGFARKGKNQSVPVDLHESIRETLELLGRTLDKNIRISQKTGPARAFVLGDPAQIQQVVLNLSVNARDAMPEGGDLVFGVDIVVLADEDCRRRPGTKPGDYVRLTITDTGCGISEDVQARMFEPFFTTKERGKGTGMGLAMVYGIVHNHGGAVIVESEVGRGTTVEIDLPRVAAPLAEAGEPAELDPRGIEGSGRILVVDDEEVVRDVTAEILRDLGYQVATASDGQAACDYYACHPGEIDLVLVDLVMPRMGGRECFRALKSIDPGVRAVLCTGYGFNIAAQELLDEGVLDFVPKPYELGRLSAVVSKTLRAKG